MILILDMDMGNLQSVANAVYNAGFDVEIASDQSKFAEATHLILPGVGSFPTAMNRLQRNGLFSNVKDFASSGRPVMGDKTDGLDIIPGSVDRIAMSTGFPVPHVGWNSVELKRKDHPVFEKVKSGLDFYFVHSYKFDCEVSSDQLATTDYSSEVTAIVGRKNIIGFQFHPEKSQINGLRLIENFCNWDGKC